MNLERLRELYLAYTVSRRPQDRRRCPSSRRLVRSFEPSFSRRSQKRIADHISECPYCREEFLLLMDMQRSEVRSRETALGSAGHQRLPDPRKDVLKRRGRGVWQYAAVVLGIALAISAYVAVIQQTHPPSVQRAPGSSLVLLTPKADQPMAERSLFKWERDSQAQSYVLEIFDAQMTPVWTSKAVRDNQLRLPPEASALLFHGGTYYWMVTGFTSDSMKLESGLSSFRFRR